MKWHNHKENCFNKKSYKSNINLSYWERTVNWRNNTHNNNKHKNHYRIKTWNYKNSERLYKMVYREFGNH